jgi:hypothetical protein
VLLGHWKAKRRSHVVTQLDILKSACPGLAVQDAELVLFRKSHNAQFVDQPGLVEICEFLDMFVSLTSAIEGVRSVIEIGNRWSRHNIELRHTSSLRIGFVFCGEIRPRQRESKAVENPSAEATSLLNLTLLYRPVDRLISSLENPFVTRYTRICIF